MSHTLMLLLFGLLFSLSLVFPGLPPAYELFVEGGEPTEEQDERESEASGHDSLVGEHASGSGSSPEPSFHPKPPSLFAAYALRTSSALAPRVPGERSRSRAFATPALGAVSPRGPPTL